MYVVVYGRLRQDRHIVEWVDWHDAVAAPWAASPRSASLLTADPDTRDDPQIPQSVTRVGYRHSVHFFPNLNRLTGGTSFPCALPPARVGRRALPRAGGPLRARGGTGPAVAPLAHADDLHKKKHQVHQQIKTALG